MGVTGSPSIAPRPVDRPRSQGLAVLRQFIGQQQFPADEKCG